MRAIFYAGLLAAAALVIMSCKQDKNNVEQEVKVFKVDAKSAVETSAEDAAWVSCGTKQEVSSPNFIQKYIYEFDSFTCGLTHPIPWWEAETHERQFDGMPVPKEDYEWVESNFHISEFRIGFKSNYKSEALISADATNPSKKAKFDKIAKQNKDTSYNGHYWNNCMEFSYIPTEFVNIECVQNYDAAHSAGILLNDIAVIDYYSAETFIRSGYKNNRAMDYCKFADKGRLPEPLNEFNKKQVNMISGLSFMVSLTQGPDVEGVYTFKLTYKDISGEIRTATTIPIRLAAR